MTAIFGLTGNTYLKYIKTHKCTFWKDLLHLKVNLFIWRNPRPFILWFLTPRFKKNTQQPKFPLLTLVSKLFHRGQNTAILPKENQQSATNRGRVGQVWVPCRRVLSHWCVVVERRWTAEGEWWVLHDLWWQHCRAADPQRSDQTLRRVHLCCYQQCRLLLLQGQTHTARYGIMCHMRVIASY